VIRPVTALVAATLGGALLGALSAALVVPRVIRGPSQAGETAVARPVDGTGRDSGAAPRQPTARTAAPAPSTSTADAAPTASTPTPALAGSPTAWVEGRVPTTPEELEAATQRCARGDAVDCMRVGNAYESGSGAAPDARRARLHRSAGARLYEQGCRRRDPAACHALSILYALGRGVPRSQKTAAAYLGLARDLCQVAPTPDCARLGDGTEE